MSQNANFDNSAHVLKQMLEGYLSQPSTLIPDLQQEANKLAQEVISQLQTDGITNAATNDVNGSKHLRPLPSASSSEETNGDMSGDVTPTPVHPNGAVGGTSPTTAAAQVLLPSRAK